jgi:Tfp pilus assembly protein PilZ
MIVFLVYGRLVYAVLGYSILMVLGVLDMVAYLTVATCIVLIVNARARENNPSA